MENQGIGCFAYIFRLIGYRSIIVPFVQTQSRR